MKIGCLWLLLYAAAVVPLALFGASMAGEHVYEYDHRHRPHLSGSSYNALKDEWEAAGSVAGGLPGFLLVGQSKLKRRREDERKAASAQRTAGDEDGTVWPPPPHA